MNIFLGGAGRFVLVLAGMTCFRLTTLPVTVAGPLEQVAGDQKLTIDPDAGWAQLAFRGRPILEYAFATNLWKPYVRKLYSLQGDNVLIDSPSDHVHHHGLMYAVTVNGINFWEEQPDPGVQKPVGTLSRELRAGPDQRPTAVLSHTIHWLARTNRNQPDTHPFALLLETRRLTVALDEPREEVALTWDSQFEVGPGAEEVKLTGTVYHGLGLRFIHPFDHVAQRLNSAGLGYLPAGGNEATPSEWSASSQPVEGRDLTVAMFSAPRNTGPSTFFSMLNGFAYLSATQALDQKPLVYHRGEKFRLHYLITLKAAAPTKEGLETRYRDWLSEEP